jgi:hypothetical protein
MYLLFSKKLDSLFYKQTVFVGIGIASTKPVVYCKLFHNVLSSKQKKPIPIHCNSNLLGQIKKVQFNSF